MDMYDNGTPKYTTPEQIYEALEALTLEEDQVIVADIFGNVSWEGQDRYYIDRGYELKERYEQLTDYGNRPWVMELALWQLDYELERWPNIHDVVYLCLTDNDAAKRLGFKKLFIDELLLGDKAPYEQAVEAWMELVQELNRFDLTSMAGAWKDAMDEMGRLRDFVYWASRYRGMCDILHGKVTRLDMHREKQLLAECRAHLTAYDDFLFGLKSNEALYQAQEKRFVARMAALEAGYEAKVQQMLALAESQGVRLDLSGPEPLALEGL